MESEELIGIIKCMLYNDNPRTIKDFDENKKRLRMEAEKETMASQRKMQIEEERRKQLKINDKKREIDELTRELASKETFLRNAVSELALLSMKKQKEETAIGVSEQKSKLQNYSMAAALTEKISKLRKIEQESDILEKEMAIKKAELLKKSQEEEKFKKEIDSLERENKMKHRPNSDADIRNNKNSLEITQRRFTSVNTNIQKVNSEISSLRTDLQKKNNELRVLMA